MCHGTSNRDLALDVVGDFSIGMEVEVMMELVLQGPNMSCHNTIHQKGHNKVEYFESVD